MARNITVQTKISNDLRVLTRGRLYLGAVALGLIGCLSQPAFATGGADKVEAAAAAYGLAKSVVGDIQSLASGPSKCVRHFYNHSSAVWFVKSGSLGNGGDKQYAVMPGETVPVYYNGNDGPLEVTGQKYHDMFKVKGCYLDRKGNTGRAVLNDPANGDIQFIN